MKIGVYVLLSCLACVSARADVPSVRPVPKTDQPSSERVHAEPQRPIVVVRREPAKPDESRAPASGDASTQDDGARSAGDRRGTQAQHIRDTSDARVRMGGVMISRARFEKVKDQPSASAAPATGSHTGLIEVPGNTLGPGESLQQRNDRIAAETKRLEAEAMLAQRQAERGSEQIVTHLYGGGVIHTRWHQRHPYERWGDRGLHADRPDVRPRRSTRGFEDDLHGKAIKMFSDAASAGTGTLGTLHQRAILDFGANASPTRVLIDQQNARDNAQRDIQKAK